MMDILSGATNKRNLDLTKRLMGRLPDGKHMPYILDYLDHNKADVRAVLLFLARKYKPKVYLEIGVRLGYSMACVVSGNPICHIIGADLWIKDYANEQNGSPGAVRDLMETLGHAGPLEFLNGKSQETVPAFLQQNPDIRWDLVLVDGDHSYQGTLTDLQNSLMGLADDGFIVVDDLHDGEVQTAVGEFLTAHPDLNIDKSWRVGVIYGQKWDV